MLKLVAESKRDGAEDTFSFLGGRPYIVGRKEGDLIFSDDQSISRKHAEIEVVFPKNFLGDPEKLPVLRITDVKSKFGTYYSSAEQEGEWEQIPGDTSQNLQNGDRVRFGKQWNEFRVTYTPLVVFASTLKVDVKKQIETILLKVCGHFVSECIPSCNLIIMNEVTLTAKAVCALLSGCSFVTPTYFVDLVKSIKNKESLPDVKAYEPKFTERNICLSSSPTGNLLPHPSRKTLFTGKTFILYNSPQSNRLAPLISCGGGEYKLIKICSEDLLKSPQSMLFQPPSGLISDKNIKKFIDAYKNSGKRFVSESEISLAALFASTAKYCNPYNHTEQSMQASMVSQTQKDVVIVPETQPQMAKTPRPSGSRSVVEESCNMTPDANSNVVLEESSLSTRSTRSGVRQRSQTPTSSAKRRLDVQSSPVAEVEPTRKKQKQSPINHNTSSNSSPATKSTKGKTTMSSIFKMSDSEDDDDDDFAVIPASRESQTKTRSVSSACSSGVAKNQNSLNTKNSTTASLSKLSCRQNSQRGVGTASTNTAYVDFVPGTPDASDDENEVVVVKSDSENENKVASKNSKGKHVELIDLDEDEDNGKDKDNDDITALPTLKMASMATCQLPTLPVSTSTTAAKTRRNAVLAGPGKQHQSQQKQSSLSSWLMSSSKRKQHPDEDNPDPTDDTLQSKKSKIIKDEDDVAVNLEIKVKEETRNGDDISPAPFEVASLMRSLPKFTTSHVNSVGRNTSNPRGLVNFKTFRKVLPLSHTNSTLTGAKVTSVRKAPTMKIKLIPSDVDYIDEVNTQLDLEEMPPPASTHDEAVPTTSRNNRNRQETNRTESQAASRRGQGKQASQRSTQMVIDVDPNDVPSPAFSFSKTQSQGSSSAKNREDPSGGLFDF